MRRFPAALALALICVAPAAGQSIDAPLIFEAGDPAPLAGAASPGAALAGDSYLLPFAVRNRTREEVQLRRITLRTGEGLEIVSPLLDGVDNDRDGLVDEGDEDFSITDDIAIAWRIDEALAAIPPGGAVERAVTVKLLDGIRPGDSRSVTLTAGASAADITLRAERDVTFTLAPPTAAITLNGRADNQILFADETPTLRLTMAIPSGEVSGFGLVAEASPSISAFSDSVVMPGKGVRCEEPPQVTTNGRRLSARIDQCRVDRDALLSERVVTVEAQAPLSDADPFADPDVIAARRTVRVAAALTKDGKAFGEAVAVEGRIVGPLLGARLLSVSEKPVDAGDEFSATYRLVNRGDAAARRLRLKAADDRAIACRSLVASATEEQRDGCRDGLSLPDMDAGAALDLTARIRYRDDARFDDETALRLSVSGDGSPDLSLPVATPILKRPEPPVLSLLDDGEWKTADGLTTARIGDAGRLALSGELVEGQYDAGLRLLSRVVDAQTGEPIAAAPLRIERFDAMPENGVTFKASRDAIVATTEAGWSVATLPLQNLSVPVDGDAVPGVSAEVKLSLLDSPEMQGDRLIELRAETGLFGSQTVGGEDWIEVLIVEPSLDVTVHSPDEDRILDLHDTAKIAILSCNRGKSSADALVLTARLPDMLLPENLDDARVRTVQIERADDPVALFSSDARSAGAIHYESATNTLRGALSESLVLAPETCLAMVFEVRRATVPSAVSEGEIIAAVEPFTGRNGAQARIYPGLDTGRIVFDLPPILLGPPSEKDAGDERLIAHTLSLEIPEFAGTHRVDLSTESSTGLDWTILRLDESGAPQPWRNGAAIAPGQIVQFRLEAPGPDSRPLGWIDTTLVRAVAFSETGSTVSATTRMVTRRRVADGGRIDVNKRMALDRDCDGDLNDERVQDSLFEPVKDAALGDCVIFHVQFRHVGERSMEQIIVRDRVPSGTELRRGAIEVLRAPEPSEETRITEPAADSRDVVWTFEGLFEPGAEGEVSYAIKILEQP